MESGYACYSFWRHHSTPDLVIKRFLRLEYGRARSPLRIAHRIAKLLDLVHFLEVVSICLRNIGVDRRHAVVFFLAILVSLKCILFQFCSADTVQYFKESPS